MKSEIQIVMALSKTFKEKVLEVVSHIPRGSVKTYKQVACESGSPNASRAVGSILKQNYNPNIPCHRVVRSDGIAGEYNRGRKNKIELLKKEGVISQNYDESGRKRSPTKTA